MPMKEKGRGSRTGKEKPSGSGAVADSCDKKLGS